MRNTFQKSEEQLRRQQDILKTLGFYNGALDGIWGPGSIAAMKKFEADPTFRPGIPNHGMPLGDAPPYPAFISKDTDKGRLANLLTHPNLDHRITPKASVKAAEVKVEAPAIDTSAVKVEETIGK